MFALVLWTSVEPKSVSVVPANHVRKYAAGLRTAKWGSRYYPARIPKRSKNREYLQTIEVTTDGDVILPEVGSTPDAENIPYINDQLDAEPILSELHLDQGIAENLELAQTSRTADFALTSFVPDRIERLTTATTEKPAQQSAVLSLLPKPSSDKILSMYRFDQPSTSSQSEQPRQLRLRREHAIIFPSQHGKLPNEQINRVELIPDSNVYMEKSELRRIVQQCSTKPKEMCRLLMKSIVGKEALISMTPTGKGGFARIPIPILESVEKFVFDNVADNYRLGHGTFLRVLTAMCNGLRNPKRRH